MEAAGIEPASRGVSAKASTSVSGCLRFIRCGPNRHGPRRTSQRRCLTQTVSGVDLSESDLATGFWASPTKARSRGSLVRPPLRSYLRQIKLWSAFNVAYRPTTARNFHFHRPVESRSPPGEGTHSFIGIIRRLALRRNGRQKGSGNCPDSWRRPFRLWRAVCTPFNSSALIRSYWGNRRDFPVREIQGEVS